MAFDYYYQQITSSNEME